MGHGSGPIPSAPIRHSSLVTRHSVSPSLRIGWPGITLCGMGKRAARVRGKPKHFEESAVATPGRPRCVVLAPAPENTASL